MGCVTDIAIALWLIAFAAGVFLLYKVYKENLQWPFRVAGWFIIVVALGGMLCCSLRCAIGCCFSRSSMMPYSHHDMWRGQCEEESCYKGCRCVKYSNCCDDVDDEEVSNVSNTDSTAGVKKK